MSCIRKFPLDLFEGKTTYDIAYVDHKKPKDKIYHAPFEHSNEERPIKRKPFILKSADTLRPWKCSLPFDALWVPKPITRTHPKETFDPNFRINYAVDEEVLKNRPRVYKQPEVSMDDIKDPQIRKLIIDNMYTTEWKKISGEIDHMCTKRDITNTALENHSTLTLRYEYDLVRTWPKDWTTKCEEWEKNYPDHVINQTELFWNTFKYPKEPIPAGEFPFRSMDEETRKEIRDLIDEKEIRLTFDKPKVGYKGYRPRRDAGPIKKQDDYKNPYLQLLKNEDDMR